VDKKNNQGGKNSPDMHVDNDNNKNNNKNKDR